MRSSFLILCGAACGAVAFGGARLGAQTSASGAPQPPAAVSSMRGAHVHHGGMRRALLRGISLSASQRAQLKTIQTRYREERRSMGVPGSVAGDTASHAARRARAHATREQRLTDIRGVLTPDQQATFDRNVADWRAHARQRPVNGSGAAR